MSDKNLSSPKAQQHQTSIASFATSEHSRDRSNPPVARASKLKPPSNNKSLLDFFKNGSQKRKDGVNPSEPNTLGLVAPSTSKPETENEWYHRCQDLQQQLEDKNDQIKAISDNRTMYQTALQTSLNKVREELKETKTLMDEQSKRSSSVVEDLLRWKSSQQAKELRERLASDGARLGRIVVSRAGMRAVESWEEGYATKDLEHRKSELKAKRTKLERRLDSLQTTNGNSLIESNKESKNDDDKERKLGNACLSSLEVVEARESIRMHLDNLRRSERDLAEEEQALNDEKGAHIRALKRVSSEDSSRFRSRPKVRWLKV